MRSAGDGKGPVLPCVRGGLCKGAGLALRAEVRADKGPALRAGGLCNGAGLALRAGKSAQKGAGLALRAGSLCKAGPARSMGWTSWELGLAGEGAGRELLEACGFCGDAADGDGDAVEGGCAFVGEGAEDGVLDEVRAALAAGVLESGVGFAQLFVEVREFAGDLGLCGGGDGADLRGRAHDLAGVRVVVRGARRGRGDGRRG